MPTAILNGRRPGGKQSVADSAPPFPVMPDRAKATSYLLTADFWEATKQSETVVVEVTLGYKLDWPSIGRRPGPSAQSSRRQGLGGRT